MPGVGVVACVGGASGVGTVDVGGVPGALGTVCCATGRRGYLWMFGIPRLFGCLSVRALPVILV
jgi:hypothetical protein